MGIIRMSTGAIIAVGALGVVVCCSSSVAAVMMGGDGESNVGKVCTPQGTPDPNATYKYGANDACVMTCKTGYKKEDGACVEKTSGGSPAPVDCVYTESDEFTPCASIYWSLPAPRRAGSNIPACGSGAGEQYKRINVVTEPEHGGAACPMRGETRRCDIECEDCGGEFKPVVKGGYSNAWARYRRKWATTRYDVTAPAGVGGAACPYRDGQKISKITKPAYGVQSIDYDYGALCGKYVGQSGDSTKDDVFGTSLWSNNEDIQNFDATVESYHKVQDRVWCAVHK
jgi:hypothetical protein